MKCLKRKPLDTELRVHIPRHIMETLKIEAKELNLSVSSITFLLINKFFNEKQSIENKFEKGMQ